MSGLTIEGVESQLGTRCLVLDLRGLSFMDASGLAVVVDADARARMAGRRLVVRVGSPCVRRLFELTGADRALEVRADPDPPQFSRNGNS